MDSALLEELGERLVGKPHVALAELVKNSYDADATEVAINIGPGSDRIVVRDNGQGMSFEEFEGFWMRVGSRHKELQQISKSLRNLERPLTGSKGIGRLVAQYLARELEISTTSERDRTKRLDARVKWEEAVRTGDLTEAKVEYHIKTGKEFPIGTVISLVGLKQVWHKDAVQGLAKEVWWLRPPFRRLSSELKTAQDFEISFESPEPEFLEIFRKQMDAILDIWYAQLVGRNIKGTVSLSLQFKDEEVTSQIYDIPSPCHLEGGDFEIRIYKLQGPQRHGVRVEKARDYLNEFGGVHVYDGGFHLPYYGNPENDWLRINFDHSHRLATSDFLPKKLQAGVHEGMNYLPTLSRILGVVNVSTAKEHELDIAITRDRLQGSTAIANLIWMVRWATDFYAFQEALRSSKLSELEKETETLKFQQFEDVLERHVSEIPSSVYKDLRDEIREASKQIELKAEATAERIGLVAPLATAGITSLAYQHELKQQLAGFSEIVDRIVAIQKQLHDEKVSKALTELRNDLLSWMKRTESTNALFAYFRDAENMQTRERFPAGKIVNEVWRQIEFLGRGTTMTTQKLDNDLVLPRASLVEWSSIFQNVFLNAFNAVEGAKRKIVDVRSKRQGREWEILIQDTGVGVDLRDAGKLFQPFVRKARISSERRSIGYGGTGLGLAIVRMIAQNIGVAVTFSKPEDGFQTAFSLKWKEQE